MEDGAGLAEEIVDMAFSAVGISGEREVSGVGEADRESSVARSRQLEFSVEDEVGGAQGVELVDVDLSQRDQFLRESTSDVDESSDNGWNPENVSNFRADKDTSMHLFEGLEEGVRVISGDIRLKDPEKLREGFEDLNGDFNQGNIVVQTRESSTTPDVDHLDYVEDRDALTSLQPVEEYSPRAKTQHGKEQVLEENNLSRLKQQPHREGKRTLIAEVEEVRVQAGRGVEEREKLVPLQNEADPFNTDLLTSCLQQAKDEVEERSYLAAQLQSPLEQPQVSPNHELLLALDQKRMEEVSDKQRSIHHAEIFHLQQQLDDLANDNTCLMTQGPESPQILKHSHDERAWVRGEDDGVLQESPTREEANIQEHGILKEHAEAIERANEKSSSVVEELKRDLRRLEEENRYLRNISNESNRSVQRKLAENTQLIDELRKLTLEKGSHEGKVFECTAELEILKAMLQTFDEGHACVAHDTAAHKQEKDDNMRELSTQTLEIGRHVQELSDDHAGVLSKLNCLESSLEVLADEKIRLQSLVDSIQKDRKKREEELVAMLGTLQDQVRTVEIEKLELLSSIEDTNGDLQRLEVEKSTLSTHLDELSETLQNALVEKAQLANMVYKLVHEKQCADQNISELTLELQVAQVHSTACTERKQVVIFELEKCKEERDEENAKFARIVQELQMQLQGLREENTHVVMKASTLDQLVEELESEKVRLGSDLELLAQEGHKREEELMAELGKLKELVQHLEVEKLAAGLLISPLNSQIQMLAEDNEKLMASSNEASQSLQQLLKENSQLIEEVNKLEQEKQAQESERMELVAGLQTVWEQLQAATDQEAVLVGDLTGLRERRDIEEAMFTEKVRDLEQQLKAITEEKDDLRSKFLETTGVLGELRLESSQMLKELRDEKVQLVNDVAELMRMKQEMEEKSVMEQVTWREQVQDLESEKAESKSLIEQLNQQLQELKEDMNELSEKLVKSHQLIQELHEENTRLSSEIDKLEEVKERHEGERLELAAELQAAWEQIQAVRESEANLATELSEVKDQRDKEKLRQDGRVQELRQQLHELEVQKGQFLIKVEELTNRLNDLRKEQDLQDENARFVSKLATLEQEKEKIALEKEEYFAETQTLNLQVHNLEADKKKLSSDIEELNQWLQRPAAEKRQLAIKLEEMTLLVKTLEMEKVQLITIISNLEDERVKRQVDIFELNDIVQNLKEEKRSSTSMNEDIVRHVELLEEEKMQLGKIHEESRLLIQNLQEKVYILEEETKRLVLLHDNSLHQCQSLEEEEGQLQRLLKEHAAIAKGLQVENSQLWCQAQRLKHLQDSEQDEACDDMAPPGHSIDDKYVTNYVRRKDVALDKGEMSPAWVTKEIGEASPDSIPQLQATRRFRQERDAALCDDETACAEQESLTLHLREAEKETQRQVSILTEEGSVTDGDRYATPQFNKGLQHNVEICLVQKAQISEELNDLRNYSKLLLSRHEEAMKMKEIALKEAEGKLSALLWKVDQAAFADDAPQVKSTDVDVEEFESRLTLKQALQTITSLESNLEFRKSTSSTLQQSLLERNSYIQLLEATFGKFSWPADYPSSSSLMEKIEWLGEYVALTNEAAVNPEKSSTSSVESYNASKEALVTKLSAFVSEGDKVPREVQEENESELALKQALQTRSSLESDLEFKKSNSSNLQQSLLERNSYIQLLEATFGKFSWPGDYPSSSTLVQKIEWLGEYHASTNDTAAHTEKSSTDSTESYNASKEALVAKLASFVSGGDEVSQDRPTGENLEESESKLALKQALQRISSLESDLEFKKSNSSNLQQSLLERNSYIRLLEATFGKFSWPGDYPSSSTLVQKIEWLGEYHASTTDTAARTEKSSTGSTESYNESKEALVAKLASFVSGGDEVSQDRPTGENLEESESKLALKQALQRISSLESDLEFKKSNSSNLQQSLLERNSYIQLLEATFGKFSWPGDYPSSSTLVQKIEWLGEYHASTNDTAARTEKSSTGSTESYNESKEALVAKLASFVSGGDEVSQDRPTGENLEESESELALKQALQRISSLESDLEFKKSNSSNLQQSLLERNSYIRLLEATFGKFSWPGDYPSSSTLVQKIEWLGEYHASTNDTAAHTEKSSTGSTESYNESKEALVAKLASFVSGGDEVSQDRPTGENLEESESELALKQALQRISSLESDLEFKKSNSSNLQQFLLERNSYIQLLEATFGKFRWPGDYPSSSTLVQKIEWLGEYHASTNDTAAHTEKSSTGSTESYNESKEALVAKLASFVSGGDEVSQDRPTGENLEESESELALKQALQRISSLESDLEFKKSNSSYLQQSLLERNNYIQILEATFGKFSWPADYLSSSSLLEKIEWLGEYLASTNEAAVNPEKSSTCNAESYSASREALVAKLAAFVSEGDKVSQAAPTGENLEESESELALTQVLQRIGSLESDLEFKKSNSSNLQQFLLERNSYIQQLEVAFDKVSWPGDYPSSLSLMEKIEWLGQLLVSREEAAAYPGKSGTGSSETFNVSKETLVAKLSAFVSQGVEVAQVEPTGEVHEESESRLELKQALQTMHSVESDLDYKKSVLSSLQQSLLERNSYIQALESTFGRFSWPAGYPSSASLVEKIEWLGELYASSGEEAAVDSGTFGNVFTGSSESSRSSKEAVVIKLSAFLTHEDKTLHGGPTDEDPVQESESRLALRQALQTITSLESDLEVKRSVVSNLEKNLSERNGFIQLLEVTFGKYSWPDEYPSSSSLAEKIEWLGEVLSSRSDLVVCSGRSLNVFTGSSETLTASKEALVMNMSTSVTHGHEMPHGGPTDENVEEAESNLALKQALQTLSSVASELEFKKSVSSSLQHYLLERNSYIQLLETTFGQFSWPDNYPASSSLVEKIEWLGDFLASAEVVAVDPGMSVNVIAGSSESHSASKEALVGKHSASITLHGAEAGNNVVLVEAPDNVCALKSNSEPEADRANPSQESLEERVRYIQAMEDAFSKFIWPSGSPETAPLSEKIEWLAEAFARLHSGVANHFVALRSPVNKEASESSDSLESWDRTMKKESFDSTVEGASEENLDIVSTLQQVSTLQENTSSLQNQIDLKKVCYCSRESSSEKDNYIQRVEGTLEKYIWADEYTSPVTLSDKMDWLAEAFASMKPEVVRKSMGEDTAKIFLTKLSYVTGMKEALAKDTAFMASPSDNKSCESSSAVVDTPEKIVATYDITRMPKTETDLTTKDATSFSQSSIDLDSYIQLVGGMIDKFDWPDDYPSCAPLIDKVEWLGQNFAIRKPGAVCSRMKINMDNAEAGLARQQSEIHCAAKEMVVVSLSAETDLVSGDEELVDAVDERLVTLERSISALEGQLEFKRKVSTDLLQSLLERNSFIHSVEAAVGSFNWPEGYPSRASLTEKILWLGKTFAAAEGRGDLEESDYFVNGNIEDLGSSAEHFRALQETLAAKQAELTRQASRDKYEKDAALRETRDRIANLENKISLLESDLEFSRRVSTGLQESLSESSSYMQMVEIVLSKFHWPGEFPSAESLSNKVQWLGETFGSPKQGVADIASHSMEECHPETEVSSPTKEVLAAELAALTTQFSEQKSERDVALLEAHKRIVAMEKSIELLEHELEVKKGVSSALQQSLLEENRYIQIVEGTLDKYSWPDTYPSTAPLNDKIDWLVESLASANQELGTCKEAAEGYNTKWGELIGKIDSLESELSYVKCEKEAFATKNAVLVKEISRQNTALQEAHERVVAMEGSINSLEKELEVGRMFVSKLQLSLLEKSNHLQAIEGLVNKFSSLDEFQSVAPLNDRILWLGEALTSTKEEVKSLRASADAMNSLLNELRAKSESYHTEKEALDAKIMVSLENEQLVSSLQDTLASREFELAKLAKKLKELLKKVSHQDTENQALLQDARRTTSELEDAKREKDTLKMEVSQMDQKLFSAREKLGLAVKKGKLVEKQRDAMKHALEAKIAGLESSNVKHIQALQVTESELQDVKLKFQQSEEQCELFVSTLQGALAESSWPAELNYMEPLDVIDWLVLEYTHAKESISLWMKRAEDSENQAVTDRSRYETELEETMKEAKAHSQLLIARVEEMEDTIQQKENSLRNMEMARGRVAAKFSEFVEQLNESKEDCENLMIEVNKLQNTLKDKDISIVQLQDELSRVIFEREEFARVNAGASVNILQLREELEKANELADKEKRELRTEIATLQSSLALKYPASEHVEVQVERKVYNTEVVGKKEIDMEGYTDISFEEQEIGPGRLSRRAVLQGQVENLVAECDSLRSIAEQRESHLLGVMKELEALQEERALLQAGLQSKSRRKRLESGVGGAGTVGCTSQTQEVQVSEIEEVEPRSNWVVAAGPIATHGRSSREVTLEVDRESNKLLTEPSEKGHGFKSLTNSGIIPKATRGVASQLDVMCVGAGRLLMRQPMARLALTAYWFFIHLWMAYFIFFTSKETYFNQL